jgi:hypothetical protein
MLKYKFSLQEIDWGDKTIKLIESIKYKCLICGHTIDYNEIWTDEKKAEVQAEADKHHNDHIIL